YVIVLNSKGELIWQREFGGYWSNTRIDVADFDRDDYYEIVVVEETHRTPYLGPDKVFILDAMTGTTEKMLETGHAYLGKVLCDLDRDEVPEIITGNTDGVVRAFNGNLEVVARYVPLDSNQVKVMRSGDIDGDGHPEILIMTYDGTMVILNDELKEEGRLEGVGDTRRVGIELVNAGNKKKILTYFENPNGGYIYTLYDVEKKAALPSGFSPYYLIPIIVVLVLGIGAVLYLHYRRKTWIKGLVADPDKGVLVIDHRGRLKQINQEARRILQLREDTETNRNFYTMKLTKELQPLRTFILEAMKRGENDNKIISLVREGRLEHLDVSVRKMRSLGWIVRLSDVSEQEFGHKVATWVPVAQQLAHGIKNPLSHIRLAIQRLEKMISTGKDKDKEVTRYSRIVSEEIERLIRLTDGFMKFTKIEPPEREPVDIKKLIDNLVSRLKPTLPRGVDIIVEITEDQPEVKLDRHQISTVFDHILDNALKAVDKGGKITIKSSYIEILDKEGKSMPAVEIRITDTGPGIPPEYRKKVFEPYFSLKKGGTGLGLSIARKIIEDHHGRITVDSLEGLGTTFIVILPAGDLQR
ncbi:GHKL domain-containing protein, partial [candidate division WOR-3 bacterium]|nr:GHKL domain-containing protein [candidate division WOR-3 bacterium]